MVNYNKGKIYRIIPNCDHEPHEQYIGSTTKEYLSQRLATHKVDYQRFKRKGTCGRTTSFILFDKFGADNCVIVLIENVYADTKAELLKRERFHIENMSCINKRFPYYQMKKNVI